MLRGIEQMRSLVESDVSADGSATVCSSYTPPQRKRGPDEHVGAPLEGGEDGWCRPPVSGALPSHGLIRSTLGAGGLSFRVRNGSGRATPAMAADRWAAPSGPGGTACPGGRTAHGACPSDG